MYAFAPSKVLASAAQAPRISLGKRASVAPLRSQHTRRGSAVAAVRPVTVSQALRTAEAGVASPTGVNIGAHL